MQENIKTPSLNNKSEKIPKWEYQKFKKYFFICLLILLMLFMIFYANNRVGDIIADDLVFANASKINATKFSSITILKFVEHNSKYNNSKSVLRNSTVKPTNNSNLPHHLKAIKEALNSFIPRVKENINHQIISKSFKLAVFSTITIPVILEAVGSLKRIGFSSDSGQRLLNPCTGNATAAKHLKFAESRVTKKGGFTKTKAMPLKNFSVAAVITPKIFDYATNSSLRPSRLKSSRKTNSNSSTSIFSAMKPKKFFVNTKNCHIPWFDPFAPGIKEIFKPEKYVPCSKTKAFVLKSFDIKLQHYILKINLTGAVFNDTSCCYKQVVRTGSGNNPDDNYNLLKCTRFQQNFTVPKNIDAMIVECKSLKEQKVIQKDAFSFIQKRDSSKLVNRKNDLKTMPSVLIIGIDSFSSLNFRRNMPKTLKFLEENNFFELQGYNKVGDNTFPNLMPLLVGLDGEKAQKCKPYEIGGLDNCDILWKTFKAHGYKTAYAEDTQSMSTFNCEIKGFSKQPTDYYFRPLGLAIENQLKIVLKNDLPFCVGQKHYAEYIYDFGLDFVERFKSEPKFGLFWTNSFSHNCYSTPSAMDVKMQAYFVDMKVKEILDDAIILFLSDHGRRYGPLLNLPQGFLEERMPLFFMSLPKWFQKKYPKFVKALNINRNRLATPFDIHYTLKHILTLGTSKNNSKIEPPESCAKAQSIFYKLPKTRNCKDACIPEQFCACDSYGRLNRKNVKLRKITNLIIDEINKFLRESNLSALCHTLKLDVIKEAHFKIVPPERANDFETYRIRFQTKPKTAHFEAITIFDIKTQSIELAVKDIGRHDSYAPYSNCTHNKIAKKFCICKI